MTSSPLATLLSFYFLFSDTKHVDLSDIRTNQDLYESIYKMDIDADGNVTGVNNPQSTPKFSINRNSDEYKKKVSDAAKRVEKRLAELHRSDGDEQSLKSNPIGNSADLNSSENYSPDKSGAQSVTQSAAKVNKKLQNATILARKMAAFVGGSTTR